MHKKLWTILSVAAIAITSYIGTSYARTAGPPDLPQTLPAHALPIVDVPQAAQLSISNLITAEAAARYGVSAASFSRARQLVTEAGPLYIIPGRSGECVAFTTAVSCGDAGADEQMVAVLAGDQSHPDAVGGGIFARANENAAVVRSDGSSAAATVVPGGFTVSASLHVRIGDRLQVSG
jgi:hypothetical protein